MEDSRVRKGQRDKSVVVVPYKVYGSRRSYFTQKLYSAFVWYFNEQFEFVVKGPENMEDIEKRSGTHQVPVVITPENWCLADSTPILHLLDSRLPSKSFYPNGTIGILTALMEEYFDEWSARWCIATRWMSTKETAEEAGTEMVKERGVPVDFKDQIIGWGKRAARAIGVQSKNQIDNANQELVRIFTKFDEHLNQYQYTFGDIPTAVDTVIMGGLRAHFLNDPFPKTLLKNLRNVQRWHDSLQSANYNKVQAMNIRNVDDLPPFVDFVLKEIGGHFKEFVLKNHEAYIAKQKSFTANIYGEDVSYLCRPYVEKSRQMLSTFFKIHLHTCSQEEKDLVSEIMSKYKLHELYPVTQSSL